MKALRRSRTLLGLAVSCAGALAAACSSDAPPTGSSPAPRPPASAPAGARVTLSGGLAPLARSEFDVGRVDPATRLEGMSLFFRMSPAQTRAKSAVLADLQNPLSPRYHAWLKPAEIAARFGVSAADRARAVGWLESEGFEVLEPTSLGLRVLFSGTVGQVEAAFGTEMHRYDVEGEPHFALATPPSVPEALGSFVTGLHGVHDFHLRPANHVTPGHAGRPDALFDGGVPDGGGASEFLTLAPADFVTIYDVGPLYAAGITGKGQKVGIMGEGDFNDADVKAFRDDFGLDDTIIPTRVLVPHSGADKLSPYAYGETILDLEWSGAIAKEADINYVFVGDSPSYSVFDATLYAIELGTLPILSISYGGCERYYSPSEDLFLETMGDAAAMEGVTVVNASGDLGPATCEIKTFEKAATQGLSVSWPASIPSFVAVGGTMLDWGDPIPEAPITPAIAGKAPFDTYWACEWSTPSCSPIGYVPESAWNEVAFELSAYPGYPYFWGATGGGVSSLFAKPYWQIGQTPVGPMRLVPDVSLTASYAQVGFLVSESWTKKDGTGVTPFPESVDPTGGTSAAAPSFAGILGLLNQALSIKNPSSPVGLGNANPVLYAINASSKGSKTPPFHDITVGNTDVPCAAGSPDCPTSPPYQFGYPATTGYDMASGIGSIDANNLVNAWTNLTPTTVTLTVTPSGSTEGSNVTLSATVASAATKTAMTGQVTFYMDTVEEGGVADLAKAVSAPLTASLLGGKEGGAATATVVAPPGLLGSASIVAFYGGDADYLASWSSASSVTATSSLAVAPLSVTLAPNQQQTFTATGGVPPVQWFILSDNTCAKVGKAYVCAAVESTSATTGDYQAGATDGKSQVEVVDADGAELIFTVSVQGAPVDGGVLPPPWDAGFVFDGAADAAPDALVDAGVDAPLDAEGDAGLDTGTDAPADVSVRDSAGPVDSGRLADSSSPVDASSRADAVAPDAMTGAEALEPINPPGCACRASRTETGSGGGALAGLLVGFGFVGRRRSKTRRPRRP